MNCTGTTRFDAQHRFAIGLIGAVTLGFGLTAVSNTVITAAYLLPILRSGVLHNLA